MPVRKKETESSPPSAFVNQSNRRLKRPLRRESFRAPIFPGRKQGPLRLLQIGLGAIFLVFLTCYATVHAVGARDGDSSHEMDLEDAKHRQALQNDERDLFAAVVALGEESQEYDLEQDTYVTAFKRSEQWREALNAIRKWVFAQCRIWL